MSRFLLIILSIVVLVLIGCGSDAQRNRDANEAERVRQTKVAAPAGGSAIPTAEASPTALVTDINVLDIREWDCISSRLTEGRDVKTVEIVNYSGDWNFRVLNRFPLDAGDRFPGDDYFRQQALLNCDSRYTFNVVPTEESWDLGDRTMSCLQDNFGLEIVDLDRLVGTQSLSIGQCINQAPEANFALVRPVSCEGNWELRLLNSFDLQDGPFPGDDHITAQSFEKCDRRHVFTYSPTAETWRAGDRTVNCMQVSYGLAPTNMELLERLVNTLSITDDDGFNNAPETQFEMVELVDCSGAWEFQVLNIFELAGDGPYPGVEFIERQAAQRCERNFNILFPPTEKTWQHGDRAVICIRVQ